VHLIARRECALFINHMQNCAHRAQMHFSPSPCNYYCSNVLLVYMSLLFGYYSLNNANGKVIFLQFSCAKICLMLCANKVMIKFYTNLNMLIQLALFCILHYKLFSNLLKRENARILYKNS
jgi:hypothetical protein